MPRKLSDHDVARLRRLWSEGRSTADLASEFNISGTHVRRLIRQEQRPVIAGLDLDRVRTGVAGAVDQFLDGLEFGPADEAIASMARVLAAKLDDCGAAETGAAAQAVPRLAAELTEVLDRLLTPAVRRPDRLDQLVQRRTARRLAAAAGTNDRPRIRPR